MEPNNIISKKDMLRAVRVLKDLCPICEVCGVGLPKSHTEHIRLSLISDIQKKLVEMKKRSDSSTYLYEQGQSKAIEDVINYLETLKGEKA